MWFFSRKSLKFCSRAIWFFAVWLLIFFKVTSFALITGRQTALLNSEIVKVVEKRDWILILKIEFDYQIAQRKINFTYRSSFFKLGEFYPKSDQAEIVCEIGRFEGTHLSFKFRKLKFFRNKAIFLFPCVHSFFRTNIWLIFLKCLLFNTLLQ